MYACGQATVFTLRAVCGEVSIGRDDKHYDPRPATPHAATFDRSHAEASQTNRTLHRRPTPASFLNLSESGGCSYSMPVHQVAPQSRASSHPETLFRGNPDCG